MEAKILTAFHSNQICVTWILCYKESMCWLRFWY